MIKVTKIKKLVMHGFKSFPKRTELIFEDGFNCVIGPNGSGKSNVFDALCFVFGKSSAKGMRAEKSADLLYNGGEKGTPAKKGEVSVYIENKSKKFPIDSEEIVISRTLSINGQSVYRINGKRSSRGEMLELLSHAKINPDSYNIVLQGEIKQIISKSPLELREIIDDVAGIKTYEERKQKAMLELGKVDSKLEEVSIILEQRKAYLRDLNKERQQALKYKELHDNIDVNKKTILHRQKEELEFKKKIEDKKTDEADKNISEKQKKADKYKSELSVKREKIDEINKEIEKKGEKDSLEIHKQVEELKIQKVTDKARIETILEEISKIKQRKLVLEKEVKESKAKIERAKEDKHSFSKTIEKKQEELKKIEQKISELEEKSDLSSAAKIEKEVEEAEKKIEALQKEIEGMKEKKHELLRVIESLSTTMNHVEEQISRIENAKIKNKEQLENIQKKRESFKNITIELNKEINDNTKIAGETKNARDGLYVLKDKSTKIKNENSYIQQKLIGDAALSSILSNKEIQGIHGTIADLGQVKAKYSLALESAAGSTLNYIVVKDDKTAADCVKYLKKNKLGQASFIPLNKINPKPEKPELSKYLKTEGVHGKAIDFVSFDPKFRKAFEFIFSNTIVVENIDVARRIGVGAIKMVTLDGDMVLTTGVMRGGFIDKKKSAAGFVQKELSEEIEKIDKEIKNSELLISSLEEKKEKSDIKIEELRKTKAELEGEINALEKLMHIESSDLDAGHHEKERIVKKHEETQKEIDSLEAEISLKNQELTRIKIEKQDLVSKLSEMRNPEKLAEIAAYKEEKSELNTEIARTKMQMEAIDKEMNSILSPEIEKTNSIIKQIEKDLAQFSSDQEKLKVKIEKDGKKLAEMEEKEAKFFSKFKDLFRKRAQIEENARNLEKNIEKEMEAKRTLQEKKNEMSLVLAEINAKLSVINQELEKYAGVKIDTAKETKEIEKEIARFEYIIENIGNVNMKALDIYETVEKEYKKLVDKKEELVKEKADVLGLINEIDTKRKGKFMETFDVISDKFGVMYDELLKKGKAKLVLESPEQIFDGGMLITVNLSGKRYMDLRSISGGEKAMTALAFLFTLQEHEPAPIYILDEVDADLDGNNVSLLGKMIRNHSRNVQYITVSHHDTMISFADTVYGVSIDKPTFTSKILSLKL